MKCCVIVEVVGDDGAVQVHEVGCGHRTGAASAGALGLTLPDAKGMLAGLQRHLVQTQAAEHCRERRQCQHCRAQRPLKGIRTRRLTSLFGTGAVAAPRFKPCRCRITSQRTIAPVAEVMPDRCTLKYERALVALGAWLPFRRALRLAAQCSKSWPEISRNDRRDPARLADAIKHIRWRLWHGQIRRHST
jgi:hypothetical protein